MWGASVAHPIYDKYTFATKAKNHNLNLPQIGFLLGNRFTQKIGAAHAFKALSDKAIDKMYAEFMKNPDRFENRNNEIKSRDDFEREFSIELRDFNSAGVVAANQGLPLTKMAKHSYVVYGREIQVAKEQRDKCRDAMKDLVNRL